MSTPLCHRKKRIHSALGNIRNLVLCHSKYEHNRALKYDVETMHFKKEYKGEKRSNNT
jgi:hypothetical protein